MQNEIFPEDGGYWLQTYIPCNENSCCISIKELFGEPSDPDRVITDRTISVQQCDGEDPIPSHYGLINPNTGAHYQLPVRENQQYSSDCFAC